MNKKEILQLPATIEAIKSRVDGTWSLLIGTQELAEEQARILLRLNRKLGWILFKESQMEESDLINIPDAVPEFKGDKTPGQRLRAVLYLLWKQNPKEKTFDEFYKQQMEKLISWAKEKLKT